MQFSLLKRLSTGYSTLEEQNKTGEASPVDSPSASSRSATEVRNSDVDMMSFSDDEDTRSPASAAAGAYERTLSGDSVTSQWTAVLAPPLLKPRRRPPPVPETMQTHLQRLSLSAVAQRALIAKAMLIGAVREWGKQHPAPVTLERMSVQNFKHVQLHEDVAGRNAMICTAGLNPAAMARHFWSVARDSVLEVYMMPRPEAGDPVRSQYQPQARAAIASCNPELDAWLSCIENADFSGPRDAIVQRLQAAGLSG